MIELTADPLELLAGAFVKVAGCDMEDYDWDGRCGIVCNISDIENGDVSADMFTDGKYQDECWFKVPQLTVIELDEFCEVSGVSEERAMDVSVEYFGDAYGHPDNGEDDYDD